MSISTSTNPTTSIAPTIQPGTFNTTPNAVAAFHTKISAQRSSTTGASHLPRAPATTIADATASLTGLVIAPAIAQEIAPVIVQEIAPVIVQAIVRPALAIAVPIRVTSAAAATPQARVIRTSVAMSAAAAVISAAVARAPAHRIVVVAATTVAAAIMVQADRRLAVVPVRVLAAAAAVARPAWRVRAAAAVAERVVGVGAVVVEVGDDTPINHALIATKRKAGDDQPRSVSIQTRMR